MKRALALCVFASVMAFGQSPTPTPCPPEIYVTPDKMIPWGNPPNSPVQNVVFDTTGTGFTSGQLSITADPGNKPPKFTMNSVNANAFLTGIMAWNGNNPLLISFQPVDQTIGVLPSTSIVSTMWPKAIVTYPTSGGHMATQPIDFSAVSTTAAAATSPLIDRNAAGVNTGYAAGYVTLINTNGVAIDSNNPTLRAIVWDQNAPNFLAALKEVGTHEYGHPFFLGDRGHANCGDPMNTWNLIVGHSNDISCGSWVVNQCDAIEIYDHYNPPPSNPPPPPANGCSANPPQCTSGDPPICDGAVWSCAGPSCVVGGGHCDPGFDPECFNGQWICTCVDVTGADCNPNGGGNGGGGGGCPGSQLMCTDGPANCNGGCDPGECRMDLTPTCDPDFGPSCSNGNWICICLDQDTCGDICPPDGCVNSDATVQPKSGVLKTPPPKTAPPLIVPRRKAATFPWVQ